MDLGFDITSIEIQEKRYAEWERQQEKEKLEKKYEEYKLSGVPKKFYKDSFDTFIANSEEEKKIKDTVVEFSGNPKNRVLILCGKNGTGKSHLGSSIIKAYGGLFITSSMLCIKYESAKTGYNNSETRTVLLNFYCRTKLLVIDECMKYTLNPELEKFLLAYILCTRYENNLPTVFITNSEKKRMIEFLGRASYDRLTEVCTTLVFTGESKRRNNRHV